MDTLLRRPSYGRCLVVADMVVLWLRVDAPVADTRSLRVRGDSMAAIIVGGLAIIISLINLAVIVRRE